MSKILIIGGSGFVGTRLINDLGPENCINIDKSPSEKHPDITHIQNICDPGLDQYFTEEISTVVHLAAEHRDDVSPNSLYYKVNVEGTQNILDAMDKAGITNFIFTSSVAVYGLNKKNPDESHPIDPFNHYGKSKWQAEEVIQSWFEKVPQERSASIIRPTVIFGEENRGNVYNLLKQIASGRFMMVGSGKNKKSMAYVGNISAFIKYEIENLKKGYEIYNYVDKPDFNMNELVSQVETSLSKKIPPTRLPYFLGIAGGTVFDLLSNITGKKFPVSKVRVQKFCATTQFDAGKIDSINFKRPFTLQEALDKTLKHEFQ